MSMHPEIPGRSGRWIRDCKARAAHTVFIGDGPTDAISGRAAGAFTVGVRSNTGPPSSDAAPEFDLFLESMEEALASLGFAT